MMALMMLMMVMTNPFFCHTIVPPCCGSTEPAIPPPTRATVERHAVSVAPEREVLVRSLRDL